MEQKPSDWMEKTEWKSSTNFDEENARFEAHPEEVRQENLNNFWQWFSGSTFFNQRKASSKWDVKSDAPEHSSLRRSQSLHEYYDTLIATLAEFPDIQERVQRLADERESVANDISVIERTLHLLPPADQERMKKDLEELRAKNTQLRRGIEEALLPLYHALRKKGYNHYDLVA